MKILVACDYGGPWGGAQIAMLNEVQGLRDEGHEVKLVSSDYRAADGHPQADYIFPCHRVNTREIGPYIRIIYNRRSKKCIAGAVKDFFPDVIHLHLFTQQISPSIFYLSRDIPIVATVHDCSMFCPTGNKFISSSQRICNYDWGKVCYAEKCISLLKYPQMFLRSLLIRSKEQNVVWVAPSNFMQKELLKAGFTNVEREPYGFNLKNYDYVPLQKREKNMTALFFSRLDYSKGTHNLVYAFEKVLKEIPDAELVIVGSGSQFNNVQQLVKKMDLDTHVRLQGWQDQSTVKALHRRASLLIAPFIGPDNQPLIVCEAMLLGTPVVATNVGGLADLIENGKNGFLVAPNDNDLLAQKIIQILQENDMAQEFSAKARQKAEEIFEMGNHIKRLIGIYSRY